MVKRGSSPRLSLLGREELPSRQIFPQGGVESQGTGKHTIRPFRSKKTLRHLARTTELMTGGDSKE